MHWPLSGKSGEPRILPKSLAYEMPWHCHFFGSIDGDLADGQHLAIVIAEVVGPVHAGIDAGALLDPLSVGEIEIKFDGFSHASSIQRAYVKCPNHHRCFKYRQVNLDTDRDTMFESLIGWVLSGSKVPREEHVHPYFCPFQEDLAEARVRIAAM